MKKYSSTYLCLSVFLLLLAGCGQDENTFLETGRGRIVTVDFTVAGIADYGEEEPMEGRGVSSPTTVTVPIDDDYEMEATFTPDVPVRGRAGTALGEGICYRVLAYQNDTYKGYADYKITNGSSSLIEGGLKLEGGSYKFVAYSYNTSGAMNGTPGTDTGTSVNVDQDFLYWERTQNIDANTSLSISFKHLFAQLQVKFDATEVGFAFSEASADLIAPTSELYKAGNWTFGTTNIDSRSEEYEPSFTFSDLNATTITSEKKRLLPTNTALGLSVHVKYQNKTETETSRSQYMNLESSFLLPNYSYTCTVKFKPGVIFMTPGMADAKGNSYGGGNCWVIPSATRDMKYSFDASKEGRSQDAVGTTVGSGTPSLAKVVWEVGRDGATLNEALIGVVGYDASTKRMNFTVGSGQTGNAIIAVTDDSGNILWSWHIWVVDDNRFMATSITAGADMDRNLGAMSAVVESTESFGLFYQWGRKDPMRRENINTTSGPRSVEVSVQYPGYFIAVDESKNRWSDDGGTAFWGSTEKELKYSPCPVGWKLKTNYLKDNYKLENGGSWKHGYTWGGKYFPSAGFRNCDGSVSNTSRGFYWPGYRTDNYQQGLASYNFKHLIFENGWVIGEHQSEKGNCAIGASIRCIRE